MVLVRSDAARVVRGGSPLGRGRDGAEQVGGGAGAGLQRGGARGGGGAGGGLAAEQRGEGGHGHGPRGGGGGGLFLGLSGAHTARFSIYLKLEDSTLLPR